MPVPAIGEERESARNRRQALRPAAGERRSVVLVLAVCLSLATGVALLAAAASLANPGLAAPISPSAANAALVRDFYAAVNDAIGTGDADALDAVVAPAVAWCAPCPGQAPTRAGLKRYLGDLHRAAPDTRLAVESVVAGPEGTATASVRVSGSPVVGDPLLWGPVDRLRLVGGLIVERQSGPGGVALVEPLLVARLGALPPAVTGVAMARMTFSPGSGVEELLSGGPTLLVVESGALAVRAAGGGRILRAGGDDGDWTTMGTDDALATVLRQGDAAIVPAGVRHGLRHQGAEPAVAVGVTTFFVDDGGDPAAPRRREPRVFAPAEGPAPESSQPHLLPAVQFLASGTVGAWPSGSVRVALGRVVLGPGARVVPAASETVLVAVEAGTLSLAGGEERRVAAGGGVAQPAGTPREVRNAGGGLLVLLVLTVAPVAE